MYIGYKSVFGVAIALHSMLPPLSVRGFSHSFSPCFSRSSLTMRLKSKGKHDDLPSLSYPGSTTFSQSKYIPRSKNQIKYVDYLVNPNITIVGGFGPAGTGKTLFACHAAISALKRGAVDKIVITRPLIAVDEEQLGFLPGSISQKMDPWTRPIFDVLGEFYTANQIETMVKNGVIEISPLAYMRGRTFKRAFIIADEMQNSSPNQMLMMLTRIGEASKLVITGDLKQSDRTGVNGLVDFIGKLSASQNMSNDPCSLIQFVELENSDIQRSAAVARVLDIYSAYYPAPAPASAPAPAPASAYPAPAPAYKKDTDAAIIPKGYSLRSYTL